MKKIKYLVIITCFVLTSCSSNKSPKVDSEIFYDNYPNILDFGALSNVDPEVHLEEIDDSITYVYRMNSEVDQEIFNKFFLNIEEQGYSKIQVPTITSDGGISTAFESKNTQLLTVQYTDGEHGFTNLLIISIRPKYQALKNYPSVPDYGLIYNVNPVDILEEDGNVTAFVYEPNNDFLEYTNALRLYNFEYTGLYQEGGCSIITYQNNQYNILIMDCFPEEVSIVVGPI